MQRLSESTSNEATPLTRQLDGRLPVWPAKVAGGPLILLGLLLLAAAMTSLLSHAGMEAKSSGARFGAAAFFGMPALLFLSVGIRLLLQRPNRYGSVLGPVVWFSLCALFALLGLAGGAFHLTRSAVGYLDAGYGLISTALLALLCYRAGIQAARRVKSAA
jgi:hypothetical protein